MYFALTCLNHVDPCGETEKSCHSQTELHLHKPSLSGQMSSLSTPSLCHMVDTLPAWFYWLRVRRITEVYFRVEMKFRFFKQPIFLFFFLSWNLKFCSQLLWLGKLLSPHLSNPPSPETNKLKNPLWSLVPQSEGGKFQFSLTITNRACPRMQTLTIFINLMKNKQLISFHLPNNKQQLQSSQII